jgi:hypothetical protein
MPQPSAGAFFCALLHRVFDKQGKLPPLPSIDTTIDAYSEIEPSILTPIEAAMVAD